MKHKGFRRIITIILSFALIFTNLPVRSKAATTDGIRLTGTSLTAAEGSLGFNLFFSGINDSNSKNITVKVDGKTYSPSKKSDDGSYVVTHPVDAKDVPKSLQISVYSGQTKLSLTNSGAQNGVYTYSVLNYLSNLENRNDRDGRLAKAIKNYGLCAQNFFQSTNVSVSQQTADFSAYAPVYQGELPYGVEYIGSSLVLNDTISIRHYYSSKVILNDYTLKIDGESAEIKTGANNEIYVEVPNIKAWDIDHPYSVTFSSQGRSCSMEYSVLSYAYNVFNKNTDDKLAALVTSLYWYKYAYIDYKTTNPSEESPVYTDQLPKVVIVQPAKATAEEQYASKILQIYIANEEGYTPAIISDTTSQGSKGFEISVGNTNRPHGTAKYSSNNSYSIQSYTNGISLTGVGRLGLMHASMRFLEEFGGYIYMSWNDLLVTNQKHFVYSSNGVSIDYQRPFVYTDMDVCYASLNPSLDLTDPYYGKAKPAGYEPPRTGRLFSLAFGLNGFFQNSYGLPSTEAGYESWYLSTVKGTYTSIVPGQAAGQAHTLLTEFFPASKYYSSHPEWYAAYDVDEMKNKVPDSQRKRAENQVCLYALLHDEEAYSLLLQHCKDMIAAGYDKNAQMQIISISKNDNGNLCYCSNCMKDRSAHNDSHGGQNESIEMVQLLNKVSQDLHKNGAYPNLYIDTLAYMWTKYAPENLVCDDHVIIRWAPIERCYGHYLDGDDVKNEEIYPELVKWTKCCDHVWIWDYNTNFMTTIGPYANVDVMQHDIKLYYKLGVEGIYLQSNADHLTSNTEFGDIRNYIEGRLLQDPTRDYETELVAYTDAAYGKCGVYVREYMKHMEKQMTNHQQEWEHRDDLNSYNSQLYELYAGIRSFDKSTKYRMPESEIAICEGLWREMDKIVAGESADVQTRLNRLRLGWRLVKSTLNVYEFSKVSTYKSENQKLINDIKTSGASFYSYILNKRMTDCIYPENHPDNWSNGDGDSVIGSFTGSISGVNLNPTIPENLFGTETDTKPGTGNTPTTVPSINPTEAPTATPVRPTVTPTTDYVTYKQFGAKGDGKTNDYDAIVAAHKYANANNLPVKADKGAKYYISHMDSNNPKGALIQTDTDWTGAEFIIDDSILTLDKKIVDENGNVSYDSSERKCFLFTVEASRQYETKWINTNFYWRKNSSGSYSAVNPKTSAILETDKKIYLGLDPNLSKYPEYNGTGTSNDPKTAETQINKTFSKETTKLQGTFSDRALYILKSSDEILRWGRNGSATATGDRRPQEEVVIVNKDGSIDSSTPLQWDWDKISRIEKHYIDDKQLTITGGVFTTKVNMLKTVQYFYRGISISRSNVLIQGVEHYLTGEDTESQFPRLGGPYQGFFRIQYSTDITLKDCVLSDHKCIYGYGNDVNKTAPYDYYAEYAVNLVLDHCVCATDINDNTRWGTTGTNYCKGITVQNGCEISRIDAHKGTYNLTVRDSKMGYWGIVAVGFGDLVIENVESLSQYFLVFRRDYGSAWYGDVTIKNCTWKTNNYSPQLIQAIYDPTYNYGFDSFTENGKTYYDRMADTITIDGLTLDFSGITDPDATSALYNSDKGFQVFASPSPGSFVLNKSVLNDPQKNVYPIKVTSTVTLKNLTVLKNANAKNLHLNVTLRNAKLYEDAAFYSSTVFKYDASSTVEKTIY